MVKTVKALVIKEITRTSDEKRWNFIMWKSKCE